VEPAFPPARLAAPRATWEDVLRPLAGDLAEDVPGLARSIVETIRTRAPDLFPDESSFAENLAASTANVALFLDVVQRGADPSADTIVPPEGVAFVREAVRRGVGLAAVLRSLRLGHEALVQALFASVRARDLDPEELARATDLLSAWTFAFIDGLSTLAENLHATERERWLRSAAATQQETVERILAGDEVDPATAGPRLGYALDRWHICVIAWLARPEPGHDSFASLEQAVASLCGSVGCARPLVRPSGMLATTAWLGVPARLDDAALDALRFDPTAAPGVRVALGECERGTAGFRRSHEQAAHASRVAKLAGRRPGSVTRFRRVALASLTTADPDQAREFVAAELGPLAKTDELSLRLAATVKAFLDEESSHARAAKRLGIHENTVRYRIRQAEELLGHGVEERTLDLRVALLLAVSGGRPQDPAEG